jgi:hypothetical protein
MTDKINVVKVSLGRVNIPVGSSNTLEGDLDQAWDVGYADGTVGIWNNTYTDADLALMYEQGYNAALADYEFPAEVLLEGWCTQ